MNPRAAADIYVYVWRNNPKRATLFGRYCKIVARLTMNSAVVEFEDGQRECISRNALRRLITAEPSQPPEGERSDECPHHFS